MLTTDKLLGIMQRHLDRCSWRRIDGAAVTRTELGPRPGFAVLVQTEQYSRLFTVHGTIMLLLYATPIVFGHSPIAFCRCRSARARR